MPNRRFIQLDVFTHRVGFGNALAVVFDADDMCAESMQRFATWANLSESAFLLRPDDARDLLLRQPRRRG
ncbi:MAG: PhzF family phenazine biosynthesis protein, partial [Dokdonella sp.]